MFLFLLALASADDGFIDLSNHEASSSPWAWPTTGHLTSLYGPRWGRQHVGLDIGAPTGTPVTSARGGVVRRAGAAGDYGLRVVLEHVDGSTTRYAHLSEVSVSVGDEVVRGQEIGLVGATGNATGPHLHFELRDVDGQVVDPLDRLP